MLQIINHPISTDNTASDWEELPTEILEVEIFSKIVPQNSFFAPTWTSGLVNASLVSKKWRICALKAKVQWVNKEVISLITFGCDTIQQANEFLLKNKNVRSANLENIPGITNELATNLVENRPYLTHLLLYSYDGLLTNFPLSNLTELTHLSLGGCKNISDDFIADALSKFLQLKYLDLNLCEQLTGEKFVKQLSALTSLEFLNLNECSKISLDAISEALPHLLNLTYLNLVECSLIDNGDVLAKSLSKHTKLVYLKFPDRAFVDEQLFSAILSQNQQLKSLQLWCYEFTGEYFSRSLSGLKNLIKLNLTGLNQIDGDKFAEALSCLTHLEYLSLYGCGGNQEKAGLIADAIGNLTNLKSLSLWGVEEIPEKNLTHAISKLSKLQYFELRFYENMNSPELMKKISLLSNLECLILVDCEDINEEILANTISNLTSLTSLILWTNSVIDETTTTLSINPSTKGELLLKAISSLRKLKYLDFKQFNDFNGELIVRELSKISTLEYLNICGCDQITNDMLEELKKNLPHTNIVFERWEDV